MKAEQYFEEQYPHILKWLDIDERSVKWMITDAFKAGAKSVWDSLDREMLEGLLADMDAGDCRREQEDLRRGLG